jgi:hypothetical protein
MGRGYTARGSIALSGHHDVAAGLALLLAATGTAACAQGLPHSADCTRPTAMLERAAPLQLPAETPGSFAMELEEIERIEIDLSRAAASAGESAPPPEICDPAGVPMAGEIVPGPDGLVTLRFIAPAAGRYVLAVPAAPEPRAITLRVPASPPAAAATLVIGRTVFARLAPRMVRAWSFEGKAGQWVRMTVSSDAGAALRLIGPSGAATEPAEGRTPQIQHKLPADGLYAAEVQSLGDAADEITLDVRELTTQPPPAPSTALRPGTPLQAKLGAEADAVLYEVAVRGGQSYAVTASAPFDLALDLGLADPLEPAGGQPATGINVLRTVDTVRSGEEQATFTAASDGQVLLRVRGLGVYDGGEDFTLMLTETGPQSPSNSAVRTAPSSR